jgi:hypothetical protein
MQTVVMGRIMNDGATKNDKPTNQLSDRHYPVTVYYCYVATRAATKLQFYWWFCCSEYIADLFTLHLA